MLLVSSCDLGSVSYKAVALIHSHPQPRTFFFIDILMIFLLATIC